MPIICAIDPGRDAGWAVGNEHILLLCGLVHPDNGERPPKNLTLAEQYDLLVAEQPILTHDGPGPLVTRGNNLITLAVRLGRLVESIPHRNLVMVHPARWKRQVPKSIHNRRVLAQLTQAEKSRVPDNHNVIDAVGLYFWARKNLL